MSMPRSWRMRMSWMMMWERGMIISFFFQAEDGIRDIGVTGVQTCALPIYGAGLEADQRDRVVLVLDGVHEGVGVAHDLDRPVPLADEVADDLDAVAAEVDDRAATGQSAVPEPRRVRSRMGLTRSHPGHLADRSVAYRLDGLERLRRVAQVLEVAREHAGLLHRLEHAPRLVGVAAQRLRAEHRLAGRRGGGHRL